MKYNLKEDVRNSQVTLTSYMVGENETDCVTSSDTKPSEENNKELQLDRCHGCSKNLPRDTVLHIKSPSRVRRRSTLIKPSVKDWIKEKSSKSCTKKTLYKRVPIFAWLPNYNVHFAVSDLVAGITVGLTVIPQAIAYANVAGLPPQVGLYSSFMACFVYTIFGSCKDSPIGPTAIMGLLTRENNHGLGVDGAVLLCFLSGCVEFLMGVLQLGTIAFTRRLVQNVFESRFSL